MQHSMEILQKHIKFLQSLDTDEFYSKDEEDVWQYATPTLQQLIALGPSATQELILLLTTEFTWSCFFALTVLHATKDPQAVPALIKFLQQDSNDALANEEAMLALEDIGDPSIPLLMETLEEEFHNKHYNTYLVGALTAILGPTPYAFMVTITKDFLSTPSKYKGWFHIDDFTYNFVKQERQDAIPLLRQLLAMKTLTTAEKHEIEETIHALEDPEGYQRKIEETIQDISRSTQKISW